MTQQELMIKMLLDTWNGQLKRTDDLFNKLTDEQLEKQVAPNRNSGIYLLGHLTAVHDAMFTFLGLGPQLQPELQETFIKNPDNATLEKPAIADLRQYWKQVNETLNPALQQLTPDQWLEKHTAVSDADFGTQPHRNKLSILISRTNHMSYHLGQLIFLKD